MSAKIGFPIALALAAAAATAREPPLHTDSIGAQSVETTQLFHCDRIRARLVFVENARPDDDRLDLADRRRITMVSFSVSGRRVSAADLRLVAAQLHLFAWIERIDARCTRFDREIRFIVTGMLARSWAARAEGRSAARPEPSSILIVVAGNGSVRIG